MKTLFIIPTALICVASSPSCGLSMDNLVVRAGLYYEKFTATQFTGEVDGLVVGSLTDGLRYRICFYYHENGQLASKGEWSNNKKEGYHIKYYYADQPPFRDLTGYFKNGAKVSD